ncbi:hypothetical protein ACPEIC_36400 [Stenotrophomonas sp. NPDC087984]
MAGEREPKERENGNGEKAPHRVQLLIAVLTAVTALAQCVEQLVR